MNVAFFLADTAISGTARVLLTHADALTARGHRVRIVTPAAPLTWRASRAEWIYVDELREYDINADDVVIENPAELPRVVDDEVYRPHTPREHEPLRVLLAGASQVEGDAIADGYGAIAHARWFHQTLELVRVSPWAPSREEPLESVQEFHVGLTVSEMTRLMHSCDVLVAPHLQPALVLAEGMAAGLACVAEPVADAIELGERLIAVLSDSETREKLRAGGRATAEQWRVETVVEEVERMLERRRR